ncbi:MAG: hypothetical protein E6912_16890 [Paeniclostridium sordellii]|nr:hypothetical protein [Paeniclostridium sordellii]
MFEIESNKFNMSIEELDKIYLHLIEFATTTFNKFVKIMSNDKI